MLQNRKIKGENEVVFAGMPFISLPIPNLEQTVKGAVDILINVNMQ